MPQFFYERNLSIKLFVCSKNDLKSSEQRNYPSRERGRRATVRSGDQI